LLRAHVERRADQLAVAGRQRLRRQAAGDGLGDPEVDDLGHRHAILQRHQDVGRLDVAVDDPFLMRVLDRLADRR
jgi:hypothetical protein